jgi:hypothetical protein
MHLDNVVAMSISPSYKHVAFIVAPVTLIVTDIGFEHRLLKVELDPDEILRDVGWMGSDCPVVTFDNLAVIVFSSGDIYEIPLTEKPLLFCSPNYATILTIDCLYRVEAVSPALQHCCTLSPIAPGSRLVDAMDRRMADRVLSLKDEGRLEEAVSDCIAAAMLADDVPVQQMLLMSAAFGKAYLGSFDNVSFASAVHAIRLKNFFRESLNVFVPCDVIEGDFPQDLVLRMVYRGKYAAAVEFADRLGLDRSPIAAEWCAKVIQAVSDDEMALRLITEHNPGRCDATEVARIAIGMGRTKLGQMVASSEKVRSKVVPLFLEQGLWDEALKAAAGSCDSSLFIEVLGAAMSEKALPHIASAIGRDIFSYSAVAKFVSSNPKNLAMLDLLRVIEISAPILDAYGGFVISELISDPTEDRFRQSAKIFDHMDRKFSYGPFERQRSLVKKLKKVIKGKVDLAKDLGGQADLLKGASANESIRRLLNLRNMQLVLKFVERARISKRQWVAVATAFCIGAGKWDLLSEFAKPEYKENWDNIIATLVARAGLEKARDFIARLPLEPTKHAEYVKLLEPREGGAMSVFQLGSQDFRGNLDLFKGGLGLLPFG